MKIIPLKIRVDGDPCLRKKSDVVNEIGISERMLIDVMIKTMYVSEGIGLAAPQVGINKRIFVFDVGDGPQVVINPKIVGSEGAIDFEEGCLSVPELTVHIQRPEKISVSYQDINNNIVNRTLDEMSARVFLHENDHLDGKLITDYASAEDKKKYEEKLHKIHETQEEQ